MQQLIQEAMEIRPPPEVLRIFGEKVIGDDGERFVARACGRQLSEDLWEGWFEFVAGNRSPVLCSQCATRQPDRAHLRSWAGGLRTVEAEKALQGASAPQPPVVHVPEDEPAYDGPLTSRNIYTRNEPGNERL